MSEVTPNAGETGAPKAPENGTQPQAPTKGNAGESVDVAELEKLRKERDQATMRANQLEKEKKAREEAEAAKENKKLEEQSEFKTLFEQEKAKREALESEKEETEKRKALNKAKNEVLTDYSDEVKALVKEAGITLDSTDDDAKAAFKEKLDKIQKMVGTSAKVGPNNPNKPTGQPQLSADELKLALKDPAKFAEIVASRKGIASMMSRG